MLRRLRQTLLQRRRLRQRLAVQCCRQCGKQPRVAVSAATNHQAVAACLLQHPQSVCYRKDIAVAKHRHIHCLLYVGNNAPVSLALVKLLACTSVYGNSAHACCLHGTRNLHRVAVGIVPARAELYRHRNLDSLHHRRQNIMRQLRILHQRRAFAVIDNLRHRAAHIEINHISAAGLYHACSLGQLRRHAAEKLNRRRTLAVIDTQHFGSLDVFVQQTLGTHHLRHRHTAAQTAADQAKRQIRNACHRCQRQRCRQLYITNIHKYNSYRKKLPRSKTLLTTASNFFLTSDGINPCSYLAFFS